MDQLSIIGRSPRLRIHEIIVGADVGRDCVGRSWRDEDNTELIPPLKTFRRFDFNGSGKNSFE